MAEYTSPKTLTFTHNAYKDIKVRFRPVPDTPSELSSDDYSTDTSGGVTTVTPVEKSDTDGFNYVAYGSDFGTDGKTGIKYSAFTNAKASGVGSITIPNPFGITTGNTTGKAYVGTTGVACTLDTSFKKSNDDTITKVMTTDSTIVCSNEDVSRAIKIDNSLISLYDSSYSSITDSATYGKDLGLSQISSASISQTNVGSAGSANQQIYSFAIADTTYYAKVELTGFNNTELVFGFTLSIYTDANCTSKCVYSNSSVTGTVDNANSNQFNYNGTISFSIFGKVDSSNLVSLIGGVISSISFTVEATYSKSNGTQFKSLTNHQITLKSGTFLYFTNSSAKYITSATIGTNNSKNYLKLAPIYPSSITSNVEFTINGVTAANSQTLL